MQIEKHEACLLRLVILNLDENYSWILRHFVPQDDVRSMLRMTLEEFVILTPTAEFCIPSF